jgi:hypothetical protein
MSDTTTTTKPRRLALTAQRAQALAHVADKLRAGLEADARRGRNTFWGSEKEFTSMVRAFIKYADDVKAYRERKTAK